ncbi:hypothetical protein AGMMS49974_02380 [Deltaproteobacteria bacterium]|nr:hypothetical protein AGMMS49974_02380 [Deltaproteobacteria bacterium]
MALARIAARATRGVAISYFFGTLRLWDFTLVLFFFRCFLILTFFFAAWAELTQDTTVPAAVFDTYAGSAKERKKLKPINNAVFFMAIPLVIIFFT